MPDLSLTEFQSLALKALRGAGYHWGESEDGARAARRLVEAGLPGVAALCLLVDSLPDPDLCPIRRGCALSDAPPELPCDLPDTVLPILLLPFLAPSPTALVSGDGRGHTGPDGMAWSGPADAMPCAVRLSVADSEPQRTPVTRAAITEAQLALLQGFAHRTYAPATEESRAKGAG